MRILVLFLSLFCSANLFAQVKTPSQPKADYYDLLKKKAQGKALTAKQLQALTPSAIPVGFADTLKKYDWYEISSYYYYDNSYSAGFENIEEKEKASANLQLPFKRYQANDCIYEMSLDRRKDGSIAVYTTTFDENTAVRLVKVEKSAGIHYLFTSVYYEIEKQQIISYKDGVLVMEIRQNPAVNNSKKFRIAYLAVERTF